MVLTNIYDESDEVRNKIYLSLLSDELKINNKNIRLEYKIIFSSDEKKMMFIMTDITDKKALENQMIEERENLNLVIKAITHKTDMVGALNELDDFFKNMLAAMLIFLHKKYP
jgi:two-component system chemotaxis sensor kinase CheA